MQHEGQQKLIKYLNDALIAAENIRESTLELSVSNYYFTNTKWIIERGIEIISEALKRAMSINPEINITDLYKIFATRNKIAHEYDLVDPYQLYNIVQKHIPILIEELKSMIIKLEENQ